MSILISFFVLPCPFPFQIILLDRVDVDEDEASDNAVFNHDDFDTNDKGKSIYQHSDHQLKVCYQKLLFIA